MDWRLWVRHVGAKSRSSAKVPHESMDGYRVMTSILYQTYLMSPWSGGSGSGITSAPPSSYERIAANV